MRRKAFAEAVTRPMTVVMTQQEFDRWAREAHRSDRPLSYIIRLALTRYLDEADASGEETEDPR